MLLANLSTAPITAHVSVGYTVAKKLEMTPLETQVTSTIPSEEQSSGVTAGKFSDVALKDVTIAPGAVQRIELSDALGGVGLIEEAGVDIAYDAAPGMVIGQLTSVDQSGDYSFEVPIKDPSGMSETIESAYPWSIENGTNSIIHLKNTSDKNVSAVLVLKFPDGRSYSPKGISLEPFESVAIDIQKLKDSKKFDVLNQAFPTDVTHGLMFWHQETPYTMIGRAEETNVSKGISSSFSCNSGCCDGYYSVNDFYFNPSTLTGPVGGNGTFADSAYEDYYNCHNVHYTAAPATAYSWSSNATTVATVNSSSGQISYVGTGTATITGNFEYHEYYLDGNGVCQDLYPDPSLTDPATGTVTVTQPTAGLSINLSGSKTTGDNLSFSNASYDCSETLGLQNCSTAWIWNIEGDSTVSDDASYWSVSQQVMGSRFKGYWKDSGGNLNAFNDSTTQHSDNPSATFVQAPSGQKSLFYIDTPGSFKMRDLTEPIDSMTAVINFQTSICSNNYAGDCSQVISWFIKIIITSGGVLDTTNSVAGYGSVSLNF